MRKLLYALLAIVAIGAIVFFGYLPGYTERNMNQIDGKPLIEVSEEAKALHATLTIVDLHSDTLLWKRDILDRADRGHMDLPRLQEGNVALQVLSSVTKTPKGQNNESNSGDTDNITALVIGQMQPPRTWNSLLERSLYHAQKMDKAVAGSDGSFLGVASEADLDDLLLKRESSAKPIGLLFSAEGLQSLEGDIANLDNLYDAGMRMAGMTHFFDNEVAGSMHGIEKGGLTDLGRAVVRRMEEMGMIVDIAHCSHECVSESIAMARRPVVSSHGGVKGTCDVNRNLNDDEIRGVARTGGVIGVGYWESAICDTSPRAAAKAMKHIRDLVGIEHVALGSDYDGAVTVRFDTSELTQVTQALMDEGFTKDEIRAVMGENALRVISEGLIPLADLPTEATSEDAAQ